VQDAVTGTALEGVSVTAWCVDPAPLARANTRTDASGMYALGGLSPGRHWVFFARSGYRRGARHLDLPPGQVTLLDVQLSPR
jgi:hypothetical protein